MANNNSNSNSQNLSLKGGKNNEILNRTDSNDLINSAIRRRQTYSRQKRI